MTHLSPSRLGLTRIDLLQGLQPEALDRLARQCAWKRYLPGEAIVSRTSPDRDVFLVVEGRVRVTVYTRSGRQVTFRDLGTGDTFGDIAATDGGPRSLDVVALAPVMVATLSATDFARLRREEPVVAERFVGHLVGLVRLLTEAVIELSTLGVQNRIHAELLRLARGAPTDSEGNSCVLAPVPTHAEIAARISTTREQVTRELSTLAKSGLLEKVPRGLRVTDLHRLESMVQRATHVA